MRHPVADLAPLAERLQPEMRRLALGRMSGETMQSLGELVKVFPSRCEHLIIVDADVDVNYGVNVAQFVKWALQVTI